MAKRKGAKYEATIYGTKEPTWNDVSELSSEELQHKISEALNYYNYVYSPKECHAFMVDYVASIDKKKGAVLRTTNVTGKRTYSAVARMVTNGLVLPEDTQARLDAEVESLVSEAQGILKTRKKKAAKKVAKPINIQERIRTQVSQFIGQIEGEVDEFLLNGCKSDFDLYKWLKANQVKGMLSSKIATYYDSLCDELKDVVAGRDDELNEAYSYLTKPQKKRYLKFIQSLVTDALAWADSAKKTRKPRRRKVRSVAEIVSSVKYKKSDDTYKIASEPPENMIDASQVWIFDTKNRFLYRYVSDSGIVIKGTTLKEWDSTKSFKKKIRKPEQILPDVAKGGKVKLRKLMDTIRAKETKVTGRINADMVIVRIVK